MPGCSRSASRSPTGSSSSSSRPAPARTTSSRRDATVLAADHAGGPTAVEIVRWGDGSPAQHESRLRLVEVTTDPAAGELSVHLARGDEEAVGRASTSDGLLGVVEATVYAIRTFLPDLTYLPGWARTIETTPDRRFIVVASVTDPVARIAPPRCRRGRDPGGGRGPRHPGHAEPNDQPRPLTPSPRSCVADTCLTRVC